METSFGEGGGGVENKAVPQTDRKKKEVWSLGQWFYQKPTRGAFTGGYLSVQHHKHLSIQHEKWIARNASQWHVMAAMAGGQQKCTPFLI